MAHRRLTPQKVREAREWYARWISVPSAKEMARRLGIDPSNLMDVATRRTYKEVP